VATSTVTTTTQDERAQRVAEALHSGEMEGLDVTPAGRADAQLCLRCGAVCGSRVSVGLGAGSALQSGRRRAR